MKIENSFHVPADVERAWTIITDVPSIVSCMPGAALTGTTPDGNFKGRTTVKIGPVQLQFNGEATLYDVDPKAHTMKVKSRASDAKGRGTVASEMSFMLAGDGNRTRVEVVTDLTLTGAVAQYGRGAGLIKEVANQFTRDFAANLGAMVRQQAPAPPQKPVSGLKLLFGALRAMIARWFAGKQA